LARVRARADRTAARLWIRRRALGSPPPVVAASASAEHLARRRVG
jgi:hypothetical protein